MSIFKKSKPASAPEERPSAKTPSDTPPSTPEAAQRPGVKSVQPTKPLGYIKARPGLRRNLWARHPNKTTRKLRKLLVSWEKLGYFLGFAGTAPQVSPKKEKAFLESKVDIAHSTNFLRSVGGAGNVGREAYELEGEFIRILEQCPTLSSVASSTREARRELFHSWHSLYLFLYRLLGAHPYEISAKTATFSLVVPEKLEGAAKKLGPLAERKMA